MKRILFLVALLLVVIYVEAAKVDRIQIDGLWFNISTVLQEADLITPEDGSKYEGEVNVPVSIMYDGVEYPVTLSKEVFRDSPNLLSVSLPDGLEEIGPYWFYGCKSLETVIVPQSVRSIGYMAFFDCWKLSSIELPKNLNSLGYATFQNCASLEQLVLPNSLQSITSQAFMNCSSLNTMIIPEGVKSIGIAAFQDCRGLKSVTIPSSLVAVEKLAFKGCSALCEVHISDLLSWIGIDFIDGSSSNPLIFARRLYLNGKELNELVLPEGLVTLPKQVFYNCLSLISVSFPNSLKEIGPIAFAGCRNLKSVIIPDNVRKVETGAFRDCSSLQTVKLSNSLSVINANLFSGCRNLEGIAIPEGVTVIYDNAFWGCSGLSTVVFPKSLNMINKGAFANCTGLKKLPIIPQGVTEIADSLFKGCTGFTSIEIPKNIKKIGNYSFMDCSNVETVVLPDGIEAIGYNAFAHIPTLTHVFSFIEEVNNDNFKRAAFDSSGIEYAILHVPESVIESYEARFPWKEFGKIVSLTEEDTKTEEVLNDSSIQIGSSGSTIVVQGLSSDMRVSVYTVAGVQIGYAVAADGNVVMNTNMKKGDVAIVKIGQQTKRVIMK